nr:aldo/keto reductase [Mesobacillus subterraneus]
MRFGDQEAGLPTRYDFSKSDILDSVDGILSRLGIEYLNILLLHRPDPLMDPSEV